MCVGGVSKWRVENPAMPFGTKRHRMQSKNQYECFEVDLRPQNSSSQCRIKCISAYSADSCVLICDLVDLDQNVSDSIVRGVHLNGVCAGI